MSGYFDSLNRRLREAPAAVREAPVVAPVALRPLRARPAPAAYGALRERLLALADGNPLQTLLFAGCQGDEGCSEVVRGFGESLAALGLSVMVVDADTRGEDRPASEGVPDLAALVAGADPPPAIEVGKGRLTTVPGPRLRGEKERFLRGDDLAAWLVAQRTVHDYVLLDAPPVLKFADGMMVGRLADGVALVAQSGRTPGAAIARAREGLERAGVRVLGVILNRVKDPIPPGLRPYLAFLDRNTST
jgi:Mrp family chromosome partitioning ATPase